MGPSPGAAGEGRPAFRRPHVELVEGAGSHRVSLRCSGGGSSARAVALIGAGHLGEQSETRRTGGVGSASDVEQLLKANFALL